MDNSRGPVFFVPENECKSIGTVAGINREYEPRESLELAEESCKRV